jgi:transposase
VHSNYVARLTRDELERRRLLAAADLKAGVKQVEVARKYGTTRASVSRWASALEEDGEAALRRRNPPGRPSKLTEAQWARLEQILLEGPRTVGYSTDIWTGKRVQRLVRDKFGVHLNASHLIEVMHERFGMSWQRPRRVARERDEAKRAGWIKTVWEPLKKTSDAGAAPSPSSTSRVSPRLRSSEKRGRGGARRRSSSTATGRASE